MFHVEHRRPGKVAARLPAAGGRTNATRTAQTPPFRRRPAAGQTGPRRSRPRPAACRGSASSAFASCAPRGRTAARQQNGARLTHTQRPRALLPSPAASSLRARRAGAWSTLNTSAGTSVCRR